MARGKQKNGYMWNDQKKIEVVTTYLVVGNASMTEAVTGVPRDTIKKWKMSDWWKEVERDIQDEENLELSAKLKKIVDKSIDVTIDRLENGDTIFNPKTGELLRVPVKVRDSLRALDSMIDKRQILQNKPTKIVEQRTIDDRLNKLAEEFARFSKSKTIEGEVIIDATEGSGLQGRVPELSGDFGTEEEPSEA